LLRGLLRLHHFRVAGEAEGATQALELIREQRPTLLVVDVDIADGNAEVVIAQARALAPGLRVILVAPASQRPELGTAPNQRPDVLLIRPFLLRQFAEAVLRSGPGDLGGRPGE